MQAAGALGERVVFTGRLEHDELSELLPACEAMVVPSTFPEAFGMVAAEAAACGAFPVSAAHSGLAEVSARLAEAVPAGVRGWLTFEVGPGAVRAVAEQLGGGGARRPLDVADAVDRDVALAALDAADESAVPAAGPAEPV